MTKVNITTQSNTVTVKDESGTTVVKTPNTTVVTASTIGPQGATGGGGFEIDTSGKIDKSVVYFSSASGKFIADDTWTTDTLVLGGNF